ncbi:precorrin-6y C5,15-methyltransferase (decarboxylating) subunit CbiE [Beijerinckia sp. L45]|uniref:precorrin-6y C5,15-methyltransferase (decarboxylating) subunit CbiE n=1 Tax=Beijerinckia sp. L45 TaxID=1641855 RepID=UPI00131DF9D9|nr:precorrin-6y C5,15-methyltransferase (decarboxylating) subunit CbiE [Beijerinckia sp. L45]
MTASAHPWLSIIGIGEDGGLSLAARTLLAQASLVVGGLRHFALAGPFAGETLAWPSPITDAVPKILARRGTPVCVLASGDPFFYGVGTMLAAHVPADEFLCLPAPSSFSLAASRLGWSLQACRLVSVHGRDLMRLVPHLHPRAKILCLSWDETTPATVAALLVARGFGASKLHVLEALGGPRERIAHDRAATFALPPGDPLNILAIEVEADAGARIISLGAGLPDDWFEHDGQITKREVRAMTLAALAPRRGDHLWDIGAGSGSVSIEWALLDPANRATAIEAHPDRAARIARNAAYFGAPDMAVVTGRAPDALAGLPTPDAIFIGGGAGSDGLIDLAYAALRSGGRLVVNAITIETQALLIQNFGARGGDLVSIAVARADKVGTFHGWRPAMPITQWAVTKP